MRLNNRVSTAIPETADHVMLVHCSPVTVQGGGGGTNGPNSPPSPMAELHELFSCDRRSPAMYLSRPYTKSPGIATVAPAPCGIRRHVCPDSAECAYHKLHRTVYRPIATDIVKPNKALDGWVIVWSICMHIVSNINAMAI